MTKSATFPVVRVPRCRVFESLSGMARHTRERFIGSEPKSRVAMPSSNSSEVPVRAGLQSVAIANGVCASRMRLWEACDFRQTIKGNRNSTATVPAAARAGGVLAE